MFKVILLTVGGRLMRGAFMFLREENKHVPVWRDEAELPQSMLSASDSTGLVSECESKTVSKSALMAHFLTSDIFLCIL